MEDKNRRLEELLQTPCYSIDFLPQPIPPAALSQFRTIQHHLLNSEKRQEIKNRIVNILLKLLCFFPRLCPVGRLEGTTQPAVD